MYRTAGNIFKNPNVGLLFINFDGKSRRIRINGCATIHHDNKTLNRHFGAKFVIRIKCEIYPNCPRYIPNLDTKKPSVYIPREGKVFHQHLNGKKEIISKIFYLKTTLIKNSLSLKAFNNKCKNIGTLNCISLTKVSYLDFDSLTTCNLTKRFCFYTS